ncbi:hypothetical protein LshimejAT787_0411470 [Lyophyllum shimeji]|uniref:Pectinesterase n=1 Tax=Lyophyllum shimeji TaxID=47721 RepID=A0A9P3UPA3_LYOSH|nr:hypothetical protein LshimejAT787_0411470 [Lyophyllum shimeji]
MLEEVLGAYTTVRAENEVLRKKLHTAETEIRNLTTFIEEVALRLMSRSQGLVKGRQAEKEQLASSDDLSGTLRVHKDNFFLYNVNVKNTFGHSSSGGQALALSAYGTNHGYYGVGFYSYQDTVLAEQGNQFYGHCYIEGAVDYIFGQHARAFFHKNTIASVEAGAITADGPTSSSDNSIFVINQSTITTSPAATRSLTGLVYLGRPWTQYARVVYTSCSLGSLINGAGWEPWSSSAPNTANVLFAEYASTGAGAAGTRASFSKKLSSNAGYTAADVLGSDWTSWVDQAYV